MRVLSLGIALTLLALGLWRPRVILYAFVFLSLTIPINVGFSIRGEAGMTISPARVLAIVFLLVLVFGVLVRGVRRGFPLAVPFFLYLLVRAIGLVVVSPDKAGGGILLAGEQGLLTAALSYGAFHVVRRPEHLRRLMTVCLWAGAVAGSIGLLEWSTGVGFQLYAATHIWPAFANVPVLVEGLSLKTDDLARITGPLAHSLILAGLMAFLVPIAIRRAATAGAWGTWGYYATCVLLAACLVLTWGRAALAVTICEAMVLVKLYGGRKTWRAMVGVALVAIAVVPVWARYQGGGETTSLLYPKNQIRIQLERFPQLVSDYAQAPAATAVGFGYARQDLTDVAPLGDVNWRWNVSDTDVTRILGTTGVLGFVTWMWVLWVFGRRLARAAKRQRSLLWQTDAVPIGVGVAGAFLLSIPGVGILTYPQSWPVVAITMGAVLGVLRRTPPEALTTC